MFVKKLIACITCVLFMNLLSGCELTHFARTTWSPEDRNSMALRAQQALESGDYLTAERALLKLSSHYPEDFQYQLELGYLYLRRGEYMKAHHLVYEVTKQIPENRQAWDLLGIVQLRLATVSFIESQALNTGHSNSQLVDWLLQLQTGQQLVETGGHVMDSVNP